MENQFSSENDPVIKNTKALLIDENGSITPMYDAYQTYEQNYIAKKLDYQRAYQEAMDDTKKMQFFPIIGKAYQDEIEMALNNWVALGHKHEIDLALSILKSIS